MRRHIGAKSRVRFPLDRLKDEVRMVLNLGRPTIAALRLGGRRAVNKRKLTPPDRARGADPERLGSPPTRHAAVDSRDDTISKITR
ncbi:hypothetical protein [Roseomonas sp. KE0001]|uniref:hypothetical protein n=1 Tax=Roseomonas sp. KE0001 TaxID=2479201 RepID=UPI0018E03F9C|nr:hypothetical protein [Roseomonas sp. KE0001]